MSTGSVSIRTVMVDGITQVNLRVNHPMEPGTREDQAGSVIPAWYLTNMQVLYNDTEVAQMKLGPIVSRNPAISLSLNGAKEGEIIKVMWEDNRGHNGEYSAEIFF